MKYMSAIFFLFLLNNFQKTTVWALFNDQKEGVTPFIAEKPKMYVSFMKQLNISLVLLLLQIFS